MPLLQYFGWVGSILLTALFAVNWCSSPIGSISVSDVPLDQKTNIRIHTNHKWPERVVFDTTPSALAHQAKAEANPEIGGAQTSVLAERQPFDAFAEMTTPVKPCLRASCSKGPGERETLPARMALSHHLRITARNGLIFPNPLRKPPGRSLRVDERTPATRCAALSHPPPSERASAWGAK